MKIAWYRLLNKLKALLQKKLVVLILVYLTLAIIAAFLAFNEIEYAPVEIELTVRSVSFDFLNNSAGPLFSLSPIQAVKLVHFDTLAIPLTKAQSAKNTNVRDQLHVWPNSSFSGVTFKNVQLNKIAIRRETNVTLTAEQGIIKIVAEGYTTEGNMNIRKNSSIECTNCSLVDFTKQNQNVTQPILFSNSRADEIVRFRSKDNYIIIGMEMLPEAKIFEKSIFIKNLSFITAYDQDALTSLTKSGRIILKSLNNKEIPIASYDFVEIGHTDSLEVTRMIIQNDAIELVIVGKVNALKTGTTGNYYSHLPSYLQWILHQQPLVLYLQTVLLIGTTILTVLNHFKK